MHNIVAEWDGEDGCWPMMGLEVAVQGVEKYATKLQLDRIIIVVISLANWNYSRS